MATGWLRRARRYDRPNASTKPNAKARPPSPPPPQPATKRRPIALTCVALGRLRIQEAGTGIHLVESAGVASWSSAVFESSAELVSEPRSRPSRDAALSTSNAVAKVLVLAAAQAAGVAAPDWVKGTAT